MGLYQDITSAIQEVNQRAGDVRVAILTGAGRCFCAGRDLKDADTDPPEERAKIVQAHFATLYHCEVPVIGAINGPAMGAGFATVLSCDIIIASENATFAKPEIDAGVNPGVALLRRGLNQFQARKLCLTGARITAQELYRLGVLDSVVAPDQLMPEAMKLARVLADKSPLLMRQAKWAANEVEKMMDFEQAYRAIESKMNVALFQTKDSHEAGRSIIEKRRPEFTGK